MKLYSDDELAMILDQAVFRLISEAADHLGLECYVVGGYVRDIFLERPSNDIDVVVVGSGIAVAEELKRMLGKKANLSVFKNFGTAQVKIRGNGGAVARRCENTEAAGISRTPVPSCPRTPEIEVEFVGARKESYSHDSRKPIVENGPLEDDQNRRDFTINAMAICLNKDRFGELVDPFNGLADLEDGIIATPLDPEITFSDDPLRMMRCVRFATQLNFEIEPETYEALERMADRIKIVSGERIKDELNKIILAPHPSIGFEYLQRCGLLNIILPELSALDIVEQKNGRAHKNNFYHTLEVLENVVAPSNLPRLGEAPEAEKSESEAEKSEKEIIEYYQTADPFLYDILKRNATNNRNHPTEAERAMWELLRGNNLGEKFRRQHVIGDCIVDFVCLKKKLVVEIDGGYHFSPEQREADKLRTKILNELGYQEIRFRNEEILSNPDEVMRTLQTYLAQQLLPQSGEAGRGLWLRWAALLHDVGKTKSKRWDPAVGWTFHNHNIIGAKMVPVIFRRLMLPMDAKMKYVQKLVDMHMRPIAIADDEVTDSAVRRLMNDAGEDIDDLMTLCEADITSRNEVRKKLFLENFRMVREKLADLKEKDYVRLLQPVIDGNEIMEMFHLKPSREVGVLKQFLKDAVLDNRVENEREPLMQLLLEKAKQMGLV
jgi:tRNA nucleotidyltransferase/poly(A) polymerase